MFLSPAQISLPKIYKFSCSLDRLVCVFYVSLFVSPPANGHFFLLFSSFLAVFSLTWEELYDTKENQIIQSLKLFYIQFEINSLLLRDSPMRREEWVWDRYCLIKKKLFSYIFLKIGTGQLSPYIICFNITLFLINED